MNAFLRKVVEQREREQEADILLIPAIAMANLSCRVCGGRVSMTQAPQLTVCSRCGGRKKERQFEALDEARRRRSERQTQLLAIAGIHSSKEEVDMAGSSPTMCTACGGQTRSRNGVVQKLCFACRKKEGVTVSTEPSAISAAPVRKAKAPRGDVRKRFRTLTSALGFDVDKLIDAFCAGWLERLQQKIRSLAGDDSDLGDEEDSMAAKLERELREATRPEAA